MPKMFVTKSYLICVIAQNNRFLYLHSILPTIHRRIVSFIYCHDRLFTWNIYNMYILIALCLTVFEERFTYQGLFRAQPEQDSMRA